MVLVHNGHAQQAIGALLGDDRPAADLQDRAVQAVEAAHQVGMRGHRPPQIRSSSRVRARPEGSFASSVAVRTLPHPLNVLHPRRRRVAFGHALLDAFELVLASALAGAGRGRRGLGWGGLGLGSGRRDWRSWAASAWPGSSRRRRSSRALASSGLSSCSWAGARQAGRGRGAPRPVSGARSSSAASGWPLRSSMRAPVSPDGAFISRPC